VTTEAEASALLLVLSCEYGQKCNLEDSERRSYWRSRFMAFDRIDVLSEVIDEWIKTEPWPPSTSDLTAAYDKLAGPKYVGFCPRCMTGRLFAAAGDERPEHCGCLNTARELDPAPEEKITADRMREIRQTFGRADAS